MGNLINPVSSRLGYLRYWNSVWSDTSNRSYSSLLLNDVYLNDYLIKLKSIFNKHLAFKHKIYIASHKLIKNNSSIFIIFYTKFKIIRRGFFYFMKKRLKRFYSRRNRAFYYGMNRWVHNQALKKFILANNKLFFKKYKHTLKASYSHLSSNLKKSLKYRKKIVNDLKSRRAVMFDFNSKYYAKLKDKLPRNLSKIDYEKKLYLLKKNLRKKSLNSEALFFKKIFKYDHKSRQIFHRALFLRNMLILKSQIKNFKRTKVYNKTGTRKKLKRNLFISRDFRYKFLRTLRINFAKKIIYDFKFKVIKLFFNKALLKFYGFYKPLVSMKYIFIKLSAQTLTADIMAQYVISRLRVNFRLQSLMRIVIRQMQQQLYYARILGFKVICSGRFERRGRASYVWKSIGKVPNTNFEMDLDYSMRLVTLTNSICAIKIWLVKPSQSKVSSIL